MKYFITLLIPLYLFGISKDQEACKALVYTEAKKYTNYPSTIVAIAFTESSCGINILGDDGNSLGIMQMQVSTAKWVDKRLLKVPTRHLKTMLLLNPRLGIRLASKLFERHRRRHGYFGAVSRYNGGARNYRYYNKVETKKKQLRNKEI